MGITGGRNIPRVALNWLLQRPTVATIIVGARDESQLIENIRAVGWSLTAEQVATLDAASDTPAAYPVRHQRGFPMLNERRESSTSGTAVDHQPQASCLQCRSI